MSVNLGTISESTGSPVPVGSVIYTRTGRWDAYGGHNAGWCKSSQNANDRVRMNVNFTMPGAPVPGFTNVYPTNLTGVGVRISIWASGARNYDTPSAYYGTPTTPTYIPQSLTANLQNDPINLSPAYGTGYLQIRVEVIKTASNWQAGPLRFVGGGLQVSAADGASNIVDFTQVSIVGTMRTRTCSVGTASQNINVPLGAISYPSGFSGNGAGAFGPTRAFRITLNCVSGPRTSIQFDPVTTVPENPNIIGLTPDQSNAWGVGVQLVNSSGMPIPLRTPILLVDQAPDGANTQSFGARYYLLGGTLKGGAANAVSTFTMVYE